MTGLLAIQGPDKDVDYPAWLEARRGGLTATEVRDLAKGYGSDKIRIVAEKLTGERQVLTGTKYIDYGNLREPIILEWVRKRFGIDPSGHLYIKADDPTALATPDGLTVDPFNDSVLVCEVKTSKHDLTPGEIQNNTLVLRLDKKSGRWVLDQDRDFVRTGYYDQMQWQMYVLGARRTLFVYEQHDDDWSGWPERAPRTLSDEPQWCWIPYDEKRVEILKGIRNSFLGELEMKRQELAIRENGGLTPEQLESAGIDEDDEAAAVAEAARLKLENEARMARAIELGEQMNDIRDEEKRIAAEKQRVNEELAELFEGIRQFVAEAEGDVRVSVITSRPKPKFVFNEEKARAKAPALLTKYADLVARYTEEVEQPETTSITITDKRPKPAAQTK